MCASRSRPWRTTGAPGIWTDLGVSGVVLRNDTVTFNVGSGILLELTGNALVVACEVSSTTPTADGVAAPRTWMPAIPQEMTAVRGAGLWVLESNDVRVWNSSFAHDAREVWIEDGPRTTEAAPAGVSWDLQDVEIRNSLVGPSWAGSPALVDVDDWTETRPADDFGVVLDTNIYVPGDALGAPDAFGRWDAWPADPIVVPDLGGWQSATEQDLGSAVPDEPSPTGFTGTPLPAEVATEIGLPAGSSVPIGSLLVLH